MRKILISIGPVKHVDMEQLRSKFPKLEYYVEKGVGAGDRIDHALLEDMHSPMVMVFIGEDEAKTWAKLYGVKCFRDEVGNTEAVIAELSKEWD